MTKKCDSKIFSSEYKGLIVGNELLDFLDRNFVSTNHQVLTLRLLVNDFGLNMLKYDTWNAEFQISECREFDKDDHFISLITAFASQIVLPFPF